MFSIGLVLAGLGLALNVLSSNPSIGAIRVSKKEGLIDFSNLFGNPSLYVVVRTLEGPQRLDTKTPRRLAADLSGMRTKKTIFASGGTRIMWTAPGASCFTRT